MLYLNENELMINQKDIKLSFHARKMFNLINNNQNISIFEKEQITKLYENNLFFFKTTDYRLGCFSKMMNLHLYRLVSKMQESRLSKLEQTKMAFISYELKDFHNDDDNFNIFENCDYFYTLAKNHYKLRDNKEKIQIIKNNIKFLGYKFSNEYYLMLQDNDRKINQVYKNLCYLCYKKPLSFNPYKDIGNLIYKPVMNIESKIVDIKRNIRQSKNNARFKAINNFANEKKISWLTLTLAHHNSNGTLSKDVQDLIITKKLVKQFINKLRYDYKKILEKKKYNSQIVNRYSKKLKYFIAAQLQTKNNKNVWHFHIMFNIDLLRIFGFTNKMMCQKKGLLFNSEFFESQQYYSHRSQKYNIDNGWQIKENKNLIIPKIFKLWADIVKDKLPNLKKLNPRSQNLQIFYKNQEKTNKLEINECELKKSVIHKNSSFIIAEYVSKYDAGLNDKEIKKMILQKKNYLTFQRLFQFSLSCQKLRINKTLKYLPFDLKHPQYHLTSIYLNNILNFSKEHPLFKLLKNDISKSVIDFEKNKNQCLSRYIENKGKLSLFCGTLFYAKKMFKNYLNSKSYEKTCILLNKAFHLNNLEQKNKFQNNLDKRMRFLYFDNYINPIYNFYS